jgi:hypothetical protein
MPTWYKERFCEAVERVFDKLPEYDVNILLEFSAKVGTEDIFITS